VTNADAPQEHTQLMTNNPELYKETIDAISAFADYKEVISTGAYGEGVTIILGNDRVKKL
jgi:hypothetical protein